MKKHFLAIAAIAGLLLRVLYVDDMEYKEDEQINFGYSQSSEWRWVGMPSGVFVPNPGMSVWSFRVLGLLSRSTTPTELAHALQIFAWLGILLALVFAYRWIKSDEERAPWLWAVALALVNPFNILYQRKLWPEPFLPMFSVLMLMGWWSRANPWGALAWGFFGALLGQIHMSGFFFAAGFFLCTLLIPSSETPRAQIKWPAWFAGSVLGALPLIPWLMHILEHPTREAIHRGWGEIIQAKFWVFFTTNPIGLHLGNPLGLLRGPSTWDQISDFVRYPLIAGHPTYLCGVAHLVALGAAGWILVQGLRAWRPRFKTPQSNLALAMIATLLICGLMMTLSGVVIRRYYLMVCFPLEFVFLTQLAWAWAKRDAAHANIRMNRVLGALWGAQLVMSACFVGYVHVNEGATQGDYGEAYHRIMKPGNR